MSRHVLLPASQNLIQAVETLLETGSKDLGGSIVVFPGKRPAHFLRKALAERIGGSFIPPKIFSIDSFIEFLVTAKLGRSRKVLEDFDAVAMLFDIHIASQERLGGDHFDSVDRFIPLGLKLVGELEELVMADVSSRRISDALPSVPLGRIQALPHYFERFYAAVNESGFTTRALNYREVAENVDSLDLTPHTHVVIAGFYAYTVLEQRIISSLLHRENVTFVAQHGPGIMKQLQTLGIDSKLSEETPGHTPPVCHFIRASDTHGQVFAANRIIKTMIDAHEPMSEQTVIVLPTSDALFPVVRQTLPLLPQDAYNIALGYPLERTPLYGFLGHLMDLTARARNGMIAASDYVTFALHPYTKNILFGQQSEVTRVLFHTIETSLARNHSSVMVSLELLENDTPLFERVIRSLGDSSQTIGIHELKQHLCAIHDHTIRKFLTLESIGECASRVTEVIQYIHKQSTATRHPFFRPYAERFIELLDSIASSRLAPRRFTELSSYFTLLRNAVASEEVPFPGTPLRGLQVLGLLETRNLAFKTVFLLNATDDVLPGSRGQNLLLPQPLRDILGLETHRDREQLIEYYFDALLAGATNVYCFYTESGNHEKSRFLEKLLWKEQQKRGSLDTKDLIQVVRYNVRLATSGPEAIAKTETVLEYLRSFEFTATALDTYLRCPLQFYYAHVLRLSERQEVSDDVDQQEVGSFVHRVLKTYFEPMVGRPMASADLDRDRLRQIIDKQFEITYGSDLHGAAYLVKRQVSRQLDAFLTGYQIPMAEKGPVSLVALEHDLSADVDGIGYTGRIDRIEKRGENHVILDYKTGRDDKQVSINLAKLDPDDETTWRDAIGSFQLPMYMLLYSQARRIPLESIEPAYIFLGRRELNPEIETGIGRGEERASEVYNRVRPVMNRLINQILDPNELFSLTDELEKACPQCPYSALCGTSWIGR